MTAIAEPSDEQPAARDVEQNLPDQLQELLTQARNACQQNRGAEALELLDRYTRAALPQRPSAVLAVIPVACGIQHAFVARSEDKQAAHQFLETTAALLTNWPQTATAFDRKRVESELDWLRDRQHARGRLVPLFMVALALAGLALLVLSTFVRPLQYESVKLISAIAIPAGVLCGALLFAVERISDARRAAQIENLERKLAFASLPPMSSTSKVATTSAGPGFGGADYFNRLVQINVNNLSDYYTLVRQHTDSSFWVSIAAGILGFMLIAGGLVFGFATGSDQRSLSYVASGSGVVVEFISGVFFYLYNRTVRQLKDYYDGLLQAQNILLSFKMVDESADGERPDLVKEILKYLLHTKTTPAVDASHATNDR